VPAINHKYHLEIFENNFHGESIFSFESDSPMPSINIGERINHYVLDVPESIWSSLPADDETFRVCDVEHSFWKSGFSKIHHKVALAVRIAPRNPDDRASWRKG
jgi:hypothetical protein